jgi:23S rRNA (guanosine2251-2'-O)-methyltransferase
VKEWLYGKHAVEEALRANRRKVFRLLVAAGAARNNEEEAGRLGNVEALAKSKGVPVERVPGALLDKVTKVGHHHQGVAAEVSLFPYGSLADVLALCSAGDAPALVLVLDTLQDPQNFGTLVRSAEAVGVTGVVMLDRRQVGVTPAVSNASAGAVEHIQVCLVNNLTRAVEELQDAGLWVYALDAGPGAITYSEADLRGAVGLVVGAEGRGVSRLVRERCDGALAIPMRGKVESLNAAVAGSVVLYEVLRQRGKRTTDDR